MRWLSRVLRPITHPVIVTEGDLRRYVLRVTVTAAVLALFLDVDNQLLFFTDWQTAFRSWTLTILDSSVIAVLIAILIGRSQRDLYRTKLQVEELSRTDVLTGLPNRRAIMDEVADPDSAILVLVIIDIDRFKSINDVHGHRIGDAVIRTVAQRMRTALTDALVVGRLGGEEFAVLGGSDSTRALLAELDRFRIALAEHPVELEGTHVPVTISAGAAIRDRGEPFDRLYMEADAALYFAKNAGRNRIALSPRLERVFAPRRMAGRAAA